MVKIAVEQPFTSVKDALEKKGYKVDMLDQKSDSVSYDCVVVRDKEDLADFHMNVPLVEAKGRTLYDIVEEVEERLIRSGKISAPAGLEKGGMSPFLKGAATGAVIGAAAGLLLTPKSGKEMQGTVMEKATGTIEQVKSKASGMTSKDKDESQSGGGVTEKVKGVVGQAKEKSSGVLEKAKGPVDNLKAKRQEKKEEKELVKQQKAIMKEAKEEQKAVENEAKQEEKAQKEHEKAEKKAEKEIKKAEKEAKQEKGGIEVVELGDASIEKNDSTGGVIISSKDK